MIASDDAMAMIPSTICKTRIPLSDFSLFFVISNSFLAKILFLKPKSYIKESETLSV